jgi:hypothetical protein
MDYKYYRYIVESFDTVTEVEVVNEVTVKVTGIVQNRLTVKEFNYDHSEVAEKVSEKISYFIGV